MKILGWHKTTATLLYWGHGKKSHVPNPFIPPSSHYACLILCSSTVFWPFDLQECRHSPQPPRVGWHRPKGSRLWGGGGGEVSSAVTPTSDPHVFMRPLAVSPSFTPCSCVSTSENFRGFDLFWRLFTSSQSHSRYKWLEISCSRIPDPDTTNHLIPDLCLQSVAIVVSVNIFCRCVVAMQSATTIGTLQAIVTTLIFLFLLYQQAECIGYSQQQKPASLTTFGTNNAGTRNQSSHKTQSKSQWKQCSHFISQSIGRQTNSINKSVFLKRTSARNRNL